MHKFLNIIMTIAFTAVTGCGDSQGSLNSDTDSKTNAGQISKESAAKAISSESLDRICLGYAKPEYHVIYCGSPGKMEVVQVLDKVILVGLKHYFTRGADNTPKMVLIRTRGTYVDGDSYDGKWLLCAGTETYTTTMGANKTVWAFCELTDEQKKRFEQEVREREHAARLREEIKELNRTRADAGAGNPYAMTALGFVELMGLAGEKKNLGDAAKCFRLAAEKGCGMAAFHYAICLSRGWGVEMNLSEAVRWYKSAVDMMAIERERNKIAGEKTQLRLADWFRLTSWYSKAADSLTTGFRSEVGFNCFEREQAGMIVYGTACTTNRLSANLQYKRFIEQEDPEGKAMFAKYLYLCTYDGVADYSKEQEWQNVPKAYQWYHELKGAGIEPLLSPGAVFAFGAVVESLADRKVESCTLDEAVKWFTVAANAGHKDAQRKLAIYYSSGKGGRVDSVAAAKWYGELAESGDATAMRKLGESLRDGLGVERNLDEAVRWYQKAAENGESVAKTNLEAFCSSVVECFDRTHIGMARTSEALDFYRRMEHVVKDDGFGKTGLDVAQDRIGTYYRNGYGGLEVNLDKAIEWYRKAAGNQDGKREGRFGWCHGFADAQCHIAECLVEQAIQLESKDIYGKEKDIVDRLYADAKAYFEISAWNGGAGNTDARYHLALMRSPRAFDDSCQELLKMEGSERKLVWEILSVVLTSFDERRRMNIRQERSPDPVIGTPFGDLCKQDRLSGIKYIDYIEEAAKSGNPIAQRILAMAYMDNGSMVQEAVKWYGKAAKSKDVIAMNNLATHYLTGNGVTTDATGAFKLYNAAVSAGVKESAKIEATIKNDHLASYEKDRYRDYLKSLGLAMGVAKYNIGMCLLNGIGTTRDVTKAEGILAQSKNLGCRPAEDMLYRIKEARECEARQKQWKEQEEVWEKRQQEEEERQRKWQQVLDAHHSSH